MTFEGDIALNLPRLCAIERTVPGVKQKYTALSIVQVQPRVETRNTVLTPSMTDHIISNTISLCVQLTWSTHTATLRLLLAVEKSLELSKNRGTATMMFTFEYSETVPTLHLFQNRKPRRRINERAPMLGSRVEFGLE